RELIHAIQNRRKDLGCQYTDRIAVGVVTDSPQVQRAIAQFGDDIRAETLAVELSCAETAGVEPLEVDLGGHPVTLFVKVVTRGGG
ncbi:MAG TPA: DUF5915 domain-containing protein, partial [Pirellulales bacterium]|nr:DUF5915 domain-containing protein [Pirellulales bacterium]